MKKAEKEKINITLLLNEYMRLYQQKTLIEQELAASKESISNLMTQMEKGEIIVEQKEEYQNSDNKKIKAIKYDRATYNYDANNLYRNLRRKLEEGLLKKIFTLKVNTNQLEALVATSQIGINDISRYVETKNQVILKIDKVK